MVFKTSLEVTGKENIMAILDKCTSCRIAMVNEEKPYILPMVYGYDWSGDELLLFIHCGLSGTKNRALEENPFVCFEMDVEGRLMGVGRPAHLHSREFESVIGEGSVTFAQTEEEKRAGFSHIMKRQTGKSDWDIPSAYLATAEVLTVHVTSLRASRKTSAPPAQTYGQAESCLSEPVDFDESHGC